MAHLTDKQKKKIVADYLALGSYRAAARQNGVSADTVKRTVRKDDGFAQKAAQKKAQDTADILAYMEKQRAVVCEIIGKGLAALQSEEKFREASPAQITTALGTLIDKFTAHGGLPAASTHEDALSRSLRALAEGLDSDDQ